MDKRKIEAWRDLANVLKEKNLPAYICDAEGNLYFCMILDVKEDYVRVDCFGPCQRADTQPILYWAVISAFRPYNKEIRKNGKRQS